MRNSSSPEAWEVAVVVYFVETHLKCRHSNRGDLKEQWSNHKGFTPWGTKDRLGAYENTVFLGRFFSSLCLVAFSAQLNFYVTGRVFMLCSILHRLCSLTVLLSPEPSTLNLQKVKSQLGWDHLNPPARILRGLLCSCNKPAVRAYLENRLNARSAHSNDPYDDEVQWPVSCL